MNPDDDDALLAELRATERRPEPDWNALQARIGAAIDREPAPRPARRWRWVAVGGSALAAAAAIVVLFVVPGPRPALRGAPLADDPLTEAEVAEILDTPDDLGGITLDDDLVDEAASLDDVPDDDGDVLLPDGAWIDDLSDEELDDAVELLELTHPTTEAG